MGMTLLGTLLELARVAFLSTNKCYPFDERKNERKQSEFHDQVWYMPFQYQTHSGLVFELLLENRIQIQK